MKVRNRHGCREAGVRSLKKLLEKIYRKSALALVRRESEATAAQAQADAAREAEGNQPASLIAAIQEAARLSSRSRCRGLPAQLRST